ncbi:tetrathionate reductase family octaheme c-type cytochrome [Azonexus sp. IMCC34839]|uniref:tetrathionate reductase family octaheme c-type cytochrome n=1 Tax=Azonexus sp. IMCC34839 TaxID=3133695 RepID=UPI003999BD74
MLRIHFLAALAALALAWPGIAAEGKPVKMNSTADHTKFKELQRTFASGPEVTKACLTCHTEAAGQVHRTKHWTWEFLNPANQQRLGKKNVINNFCISIPSNYAFCTSCHVGYGWKDANFDFSVEENVDCLACHDTTGSYKKLPGLAGHPPVKDTEAPPGSGKIVKGIDLTKVAQKVGKTSRDTCGSCHFFGGGGDGVKHGDMDSSLASPDKELDVHMDATGLDFTCGTCHMTSSHDVPGSRYTPVAVDRGGAHLRGKEDKSSPATCQSCHGQSPHKGRGVPAKLNDHTDKVACQTCHIPAIARGGVATKTNWDWSTAGKLSPEGKPILKKDEKGRIIYDSKKGDFTLGENVVPEYVWFNGDITYTLLNDKIENSDGITKINALGGSPSDGRSMIWPMKIFRGTQPYDPENRTLVTPHTAGNDDTAYWKNFGWEKAIDSGMKVSGAPFSGKVGFIKTEMSWPITHMVAPKDKALGCNDCHARNGRLDKVSGIYIPGRDGHPLINTLGWLAAGGLLCGVSLHGLIRFLRRKH